VTALISSIATRAALVFGQVAFYAFSLSAVKTLRSRIEARATLTVGAKQEYGPQESATHRSDKGSALIAVNRFSRIIKLPVIVVHFWFQSYSGTLPHIVTRQ